MLVSHILFANFVLGNAFITLASAPCQVGTPTMAHIAQKAQSDPSWAPTGWSTGTVLFEDASKKIVARHLCWHVSTDGQSFVTIDEVGYTMSLDREDMQLSSPGSRSSGPEVEPQKSPRRDMRL
jgi:hypothetical protein